MDRQTILESTRCDLKRLPLGALEAFVLSQVDGRLTLEEVAEVAGLDFSQAARLARRLVELGAVSALEARPVANRARVDPRAEKPSLRPPPQAATRPERSRSRKSLRVATARAESSVAEEGCDLDDATVTTIASLDATLKTADHYALLGLERGADKKAIKRAYFGLASRFHPDRFFGKKLGASRARVDRIFHRLTEAHDVLTSVSRRAAYDATLAPAAPAAVRKVSRAIRAASRQIEAVTAATPAPAAKSSRRPPPNEQVVPRRSVAPPSRKKSLVPPSSDDRKSHLRTGAIEVKVQARIDLLVGAAESALLANDVAGAANHLRLALEHRDDPRIRVMFEDVDARARALRFDKNLAAARSAELSQRWADAAVFLGRAYEARADSEVASRAAKALRVSGGDLARAAAFAEKAVALAPRNGAYRVTLAEIYLAANRLGRAEEECATARELAPKSESVKALVEAIATKANGKPR
ncbi:MAG TPA: DnaJ domain-containing protein [Labilithrix sp.]|nr:DnaJ domain-containing protein [Labilithrix sp.]